ncbi:hypothetical protein D3C78_1350760 [compost metagenome]
MGLGGFLDQVGGGVRTGFFAGVEQEGDLRVILEVEVLEHLQGVDPGDDAALVIHHPRPIGPAILDVEGTLGGRAFLEDRVHVGHQQDFCLAGALEGRQDVLGAVRVRHLFDGGAQLRQFIDRNITDLGQPRHIA